MFLVLLLGTVLAAARGAPPQGPDSARAAVYAAERAVADDSAAAVTARWRAVLARDPADRTAALGLATVARVTYDFETAERLLHGVLSRPGGPDPWTVQARIGLYRVALSRGDLHRADSLVTRAITEARRIGDRGSEVDALIGLSNTRAALRVELEAALAVLDTLERVLPPGDRWERAEHLCRLGLYRGIGGDTAAPGILRRGIGVAERVGDRQLTGHCLEAHALVHSLLGRSDSVLPIMDRAAELLRATHAHASLARLESRRSDVLQARGRLGEARLALDRVIAGATRSRNRARMANAYGGLGMLALTVGDLETASGLFERAAAINDSLGQVEGAMIARQNRAEVLAAAGDLAAAREALLGTLEEARRAGAFEDAIIARQRLARVAIRTGDLDRAERQLSAADAEARRLGLEEVRSAMAYDQGRLALARGDHRGAARRFALALSRTPPDDHLPRYAIRVRLAEAWARAGGLDRAERKITQAFADLETWRAALNDQELRRYAFAATALGEHDPQAPVARVLAALAEGGRADRAFALAEQRRARSLTDRLNQAEALRERAGPPPGTTARARASTVAQIMQALPDDRTALVEYVAGSEGAPTTVFVLARSGVRARVLPPADTLAPAIARLVALLEHGEPAEGLARGLGSALLQPVAEMLPDGVTRLVVVPDGPLHRLPFDVLRLADGRAAVEHWALGLAPSASVAAALWRSRPSPDSAAARLVALGDPAFAREQAALAMREADPFRSAFEASGGLPRLTASGDEARAVARFAPAGAEVRLRDEASESWLMQAPLERYRVVHLATHALVDERTLARTALALAPGGGEDGFVTPADLARLRLRADLVVLSACRTAGGVTVTGEGVQGLTMPLLAAGARAVVATQWRVGDRSTVRLVGDFYRGLARGLPAAEALQAAKLAALRRGAPAGEWAGFTVVGDPLAPVAVREPVPESPGARWAAAAAALLLMLGGAYGVVSRRGRRAERGPGAGVSATTHQR